MKKVGVFIAQGPPVPIPNTEVKPCGAEDTCLATNRENRSMPTFFHIYVKNSSKISYHVYDFCCFNTVSLNVTPIYSSLAQLAEHLTVNQVVAGSSPAGGANKETTQKGGFFIGFSH